MNGVFSNLCQKNFSSHLFAYVRVDFQTVAAVVAVVVVVVVSRFLKAAHVISTIAHNSGDWIW